MSASTGDQNHPVLNLTAEEKRVYGSLFSQADREQLGVVTGENAVTFFERTRVSPNVLGEIWQIADQENRGLLTKPGFCIVLRLIGHYQAGREPSLELAFKPAPMPRFDAGGPLGGPMPTVAPAPTSPAGQAAFAPNVLQPQLSGTPPIRVPPLDAQKSQQFASLFERSSTQNGLIDGATAKAIFERAGLPNEVLGRIWNLSDREQKGALDATEFIVAMHLLTSIKSRAMPALPATLPQGLYEAAARRGLPPPGRPIAAPGAIPRQLTGNSTGTLPRTQSPLVRSPGPAAVPIAQASAAAWLVTPAEKAKYDQFFTSIDVTGQGTISGEQAVSFFSDSRLPEDTLAQIWDLADINSEGHLNREEFAVAMYLIRQQRAPNAGPLPAFLPPALTPPSMRKSQQPTLPQTQLPPAAPPVFDSAPSNLPKSAADDLFGLDEPAVERSDVQPALLPTNHTGTSTSNDPFRTNQLTSPGSPQRSQNTGPSATSAFKPFTPTSAFGASLAQQTTGGSAMSSQATGTPRGQQRSAAPPVARATDDLLGDSDVQNQESSSFTNDTTELANMSNQIGNLRGQMEQTQTKKSTTQAELAAANAQKSDLEIRLKQFRQQYEHEVRLVKDMETQLTASRESSKQLGQELAMLEGSYQDLQTRRESTSQALQADQRENTDLKARISHLNAEVARLKTEVEKMKLDARQQKGLVSINKKQIATNENERDRLQKEREDLEKQAQAAAEQSRAVTSPDISAPATTAVPLASPAESLSTTNPFARKAGLEAGNERASSPFTPLSTGSASAASAFDALFGPASTANAESDRTKLSNGSPPVTTFGRASTSTADDFTLPDSKRNDPNAGEPTLPATPPSADRVKDGQYPIDASSPPPPPEGRQFTASQLPIINLEHKAHDSETRSTHVMPPASRAGEPDNSSEFTPTPGTIFGSGNGAEVMPGAFPAAPASGPPTSVGRPQSAKDDFDAAFADFEEDQQSRALASSSNLGPNHNASGSSRSAPEFPPIQTLEHDDEDDDSSDDEDDDDDDAENKVHTGFEDDFSSASAAKGAVAGSGTAPATSNTIAAPVPEAPATPLPAVDAQRSPPTYEESHQPSHGGKGNAAHSNQVPPEFDGLLPSREDPTSGDSPATQMPPGSAVSATRDAVEFSNAGPSASDVERSLVAPSRTNTVDVFHDASSRPISGATETRAVTDGDQASTNTDILDEFDDFADLAEAKEVDKSASNDIDFGFDRAETAEFNPVFDSPAASTTNTVVSSYPTPVASSRSTGAQENSTGGLLPSKPAVRALDYASNGGSDEQSSKASQHDWDSIFAGLDNTKSIDLSSDPWSSGGSSAGKPAPGVSQTKPQYGTAITPGTEHDDPILKRLTGMGYPRKAALDALEQYDYDINKAVDHLSG